MLAPSLSRKHWNVSLFGLLLLGLFVLPVVVSFCLPDPRASIPWYEARRDPTGLAPDPATTQEAVIQVYAAPAVSWRGRFAVHTWIVVKPTGAERFTRYEVVGFGVASGAPAVRVDRMGPDNYWFGARPQIVLDRRGVEVAALIDKVHAAVASYPYPHEYRAWPGPNSNTFTAYVARQVPRTRPRSPLERDRQGFSAGRCLVRRGPERRRLPGLALRPRRSLDRPRRGTGTEPPWTQSRYRRCRPGAEASGHRPPGNEPLIWARIVRAPGQMTALTLSTVLRQGTCRSSGPLLPRGARLRRWIVNHGETLVR
jgi:hypothetical protein